MTETTTRATFYAVTANMTTEADGWTSTRHLPTFYLCANAQGIVSEEHAERIARDILDPFARQNDAALHLTAVAIDIH